LFVNNSNAFNSSFLGGAGIGGFRQFELHPIEWTPS
jgi:hypothetical protein